MLTIKEYAIQMRVSPRTVRRWIKEGRVSVVMTPSGRKLVLWELPEVLAPEER